MSNLELIRIECKVHNTAISVYAQKLLVEGATPRLFLICDQCKSGKRIIMDSVRLANVKWRE